MPHAVLELRQPAEEVLRKPHSPLWLVITGRRPGNKYHLRSFYRRHFSHVLLETMGVSWPSIALAGSSFTSRYLPKPWWRGIFFTIRNRWIPENGLVLGVSAKRNTIEIEEMNSIWSGTEAQLQFLNDSYLDFNLGFLVLDIEVFTKLSGK